MIGLVSCSSTKLAHPAIAAKLYSSPLFRKALAYAERRCTTVYVLSALYGLVELDRMLDPYDYRLGRKSERELWAHKVTSALSAKHARHEDLLILAGDDYARPLRGKLHGWWTGAIEEPLRRFPVGERLRWLNAEIEKLPPQLPAPKADPVAIAATIWVTPRQSSGCACTCESCCSCKLQLEVACSFCGAPESKARLVSGPRAFICAGCINLCIDILDAQPEAA